jgi:hypothetical protein
MAFINSCVSNAALVLVIAVGFGYLIGMLLRLFQTELPDKLSAAWGRSFESRAREKGRKGFKLWATEDFPYIGWIGESCKLYLPPEAQAFYERVWANRKQDGPNKQFFNYCKILIVANDERSANEIYAAESVTRYISGMFYALILSFVSILLPTIPRYLSGQSITGIGLLLVAYFLAIVVIVQHFRFIRIKEVETVFAASFKNREIFEGVQDGVSTKRASTTSGHKLRFLVFGETSKSDRETGPKK